MARLEKHIIKYFWEYDKNAIDPQEHWFFVLERLMEYGDVKAMKWAVDFYESSQFIEVLRNSRRLSRKSATMWQNYFNLPKEEVKCLNISCQPTDIPFLSN